jgi:hypothetical protein
LERKWKKTINLIVSILTISTIITSCYADKMNVMTENQLMNEGINLILKLPTDKFNTDIRVNYKNIQPEVKIHYWGESEKDYKDITLSDSNKDYPRFQISKQDIEKALIKMNKNIKINWNKTTTTFSIIFISPKDGRDSSSLGRKENVLNWGSLKNEFMVEDLWNSIK